MERIAIVTGGTRGIGAAIARRLANDGYRVATVFHGNVAAAEAFGMETGIRTFQWDVADFEACASGVAGVARDMGGPVDILVNNAGITRDAMLHKMTPVQWNEVIASDLTSCFNMCRAVIEPMRERSFGRIVNISSDAARVGSSGESVYSACKGGIISFSKTLAREVARKNITVNVVCPGPTDTPILRSFLGEGDAGQKVYDALVRAIPMKRVGQPDDIPGLVAFLASDEAGFITGQVISVSGGLTMAG